MPLETVDSTARLLKLTHKEPVKARFKIPSRQDSQGVDCRGAEAAGQSQAVHLARCINSIRTASQGHCSELVETIHGRSAVIESTALYYVRKVLASPVRRDPRRAPWPSGRRSKNCRGVVAEATMSKGARDPSTL